MEAASGDMGHKGVVTGGDPDAIRLVTSTDTERDNIEVTQGNVEART